MTNLVQYARTAYRRNILVIINYSHFWRHHDVLVFMYQVRSINYKVLIDLYNKDTNNNLSLQHHQYILQAAAEVVLVYFTRTSIVHQIPGIYLVVPLSPRFHSSSMCICHGQYKTPGTLICVLLIIAEGIAWPNHLFFAVLAMYRCLVLGNTLWPQTSFLDRAHHQHGHWLRRMKMMSGNTHIPKSLDHIHDPWAQSLLHISLHMPQNIKISIILTSNYTYMRNPGLQQHHSLGRPSRLLASDLNAVVHERNRRTNTYMEWVCTD